MEFSSPQEGQDRERYSNVRMCFSHQIFEILCTLIMKVILKKHNE